METTLTEKKDDFILRKLREKFTPEQLADIYCTPLIISHIALCYAGLASDYAATNRLPYKLPVRRIRELSQEYGIIQRTAIGSERYNSICGQVDDLITENARHFNTLYWTINGEWKKNYPDDSHNVMRTFAIMSHCFIKTAYLHVKRINVWARLDGHSLSLVHPVVDSVGNMLNALVGDRTIESTENINLAMKIIDNILQSTTFTIQ